MNENSNTVAEMLTKNGIAVFPVHGVDTNGKCTCGKSHDGDERGIGKHPANTTGCKGFTHDPKQIAKWLDDGFNIACSTGDPSGVWVLDIDKTEAFEKLKQFGTLPKTCEATTGRGTHFYFRHNEKSKSLKNWEGIFGGLDTRTTGGYTILPPSKHKNGTLYTWVVSPDDMEPATAPDWLIDLLIANSKKQKTEKPKEVEKQDPKSEVERIQKSSTTEERCINYLRSIEPAISGQSGHNQTFSTVCKIVEKFGELTDEELLICLNEWNSKSDPPWTEKELLHKLNEARKKTGKSSESHSVDSKANKNHSSSSASKSTQSDSRNSSESTENQNHNSDESIPYPVLSQDAYCGIIGDIVKAIDPETEAHPAAVLLSLLTAIGNSIGKNPHATFGAESHGVNLFTCIVGDSASGKGQSWNIARHLLRKTDSTWGEKTCSYGLSSGEGLIERVSDSESEDSFKVPETKRLLCVETEFAKPVSAMRRENNTLSPILRAAWDCSPLEVMTRGKSKLRAANAFISILAHITPQELRKLYDGSVETSNGFANRFLWCHVHSEKCLPHGGDLSVADIHIQRLAELIESAKQIGEVKDSIEYRQLWEVVYPNLKESKTGVYGRATERARPQIVRLALLYALLDGSKTREEKHLKAALAVWQFCEESARMLFSSRDELLEFNKYERKLIQLVNENPSISRSALKQGISHRIKTSEFDSMLERLTASGRISKVAGTRSETFVAPVPETKPVPVSEHFSDEQSISIEELIHWKNQNGIQFTFNNQLSLYWVATQYTERLTTQLEKTMIENQEILKMFTADRPDTPQPYQSEPVISPQSSHTQLEEITLSDDGEAFFKDLMAMIDTRSSTLNV